MSVSVFSKSLLATATTTAKRLGRLMAPLMMLSVGGCLPNNTFSNILGSSLSEVAGFLLSDLLEVLFPVV